jgi:predicted  nucleic acid-binding Zn-ribbon protein
VRDLLQLTADQGQTSEAEFVVERLYREEARNATLPLAWITEARLRIACVLLLLAHVLWLVRGRSAQLAASPEGGEVIAYQEATRPLLALSVCAALLLLAAPAVLPTPETVASATIASIQDDAAAALADATPTGGSPTDQRAKIEAAFEAQRHNLALLDGNTGDVQESVFALVNRVRERVEQIDVTLRSEDTSLAETHRRDIEALRMEQAGDHDRLAALDTAMQSQAAGIREVQDSLTRAQAGLQASVSGQQSRLNELQAALTQARAQIDEATQIAQSTRESLNSRMTELAGTVSQLQAGLQRVNTQLTQQVQGVRVDLINELRSESQARAQLANRVSALEQSGGNVNAFNQRIAQVARELSELTARVNGYHPNVITRAPGARDTFIRQPPAETTAPPPIR